MAFPSFLSLALLAIPSNAALSAWNGHTTPASTTPTLFTPFYVPPGTAVYHDDNPLVRYSGSWRRLTSSHTSSSIDASLSFNFSGTGLEWYGTAGKRHGFADVSIDGLFYKSANTWASHDHQQQLLFSAYNLSSGPHSITIVNRPSSTRTLIDVDAFVVTIPDPSQPSSLSHFQSLNAVQQPASQWSLAQQGSTGVAAMQLSIISATHAIVIDKVEHNPLTISGHPAWGALYNLDTHSVRPLTMKSNSFCAGGSFLSNGTLINVGGNPVVSDHTSAADFGDVNGLQAIRLFHPCDSASAADCDIYENHASIRMASPRWYNTVLRISDGSAMIIGGSKKGGWINNSTTNNPTIEYYPPKNINGSNGLPIQLPLLVDTLNSNLFPIAFSLPGGKIFIAANQDATIYDWQSNTERRLPQIPNGVRVTYPMTGTGLLLPLSPENQYTPEILLCGGSTVDDTKPGYQISSQEPASAQCSRIVLTDEGISAGWQVEQMPQARIMPDAVLLPTGQVVIVNGGATGISGYANVIGQVGQSNADNPVLAPTLYDPAAPAGARFTTGLTTSEIPRLYHSTATLTPRGDVMLAGSNPNLDRSAARYGTEYRVEWLGPPYMAAPRPTLADVPPAIAFDETVALTLQLAAPATAGAPVVRVACMDLGYVTHAVHANARLVYLVAALGADGRTLRVTGPPDAGVYPPGPAWLYVLVDNVPSVGVKVMIGDGRGPPVDDAALQNVLKQTTVDQGENGAIDGSE